MSGETKFTPGPWKAAASGSSIVGWPVVAPKDMGRMICNVSFAAHSPTNPAVPGDQAFNAESKANAHLIAASPDLFEACAEFVRKVDAGEARSTKSYEQMKAALAKARGES